jgi:hypothetical protein
VPNPTYLSLEEAIHKYGVKEKVLIQLIADGMVQTRTTSSGELLVVVDKNGDSHEPQTKEEIIAKKYAHLKDEKISASEASRKYSKIYGITISHPNFSRWAKAGFIQVIKRGYRLQMNEADVAYCAEIYVRKHKEYSGQMIGVRIFDKNGNPYRVKYPEVAEQMRIDRRSIRQHIVD